MSDLRKGRTETPLLLKDLEIILKEGAREVGVFLNREMVQMFLAYLKELKEWNQRVNLTSLKEDGSIITKHFIDSLSLVPYLPAKASLLDLGSGAGFPGIPIKIANPSLEVTLLEAKRKKVNFQRHVVRILGLTNITVIQADAKCLKSENEESLSFDIVTSRAFSRLGIFLMIGSHLVKKGGYLVAMKGRQVDKELKDSHDAIKSLSFEINNKVKLRLPVSGEKRCLIFMKKT